MNVKKIFGVALSVALMLSFASWAFAYDANNIQSWSELAEAISDEVTTITIRNAGITVDSATDNRIDTKVDGLTIKGGLISAGSAMFSINNITTIENNIKFNGPTGGVTAIAIESNSDLTLSGTIEMTNNGTLVNITGGTTIISSTSVTVSGNGTAFALAGGNLTLSGAGTYESSKKPDTSNGGLITITNGTLTASGGQTFKFNGNGTGDTTAIYVKGGDHNLTGVTIRDSNAQNAIVVNGGTVTFNGQTITANSASPLFDVQSGTVTFNGASNSISTNTGRPINISGGTVELNGTTVSGNITGAQAINLASGTLTATGATFSTNTNANEVVCVNDGTATFDNCTFNGNGSAAFTAPSKAVLNILGGTATISHGAGFTSNNIRAVKIAGSNAQVTVDDITFSGNKGAIDIEAGSLTVKKATFTNNDASVLPTDADKDGGALRIGAAATVDFQNPDPLAFTGNKGRKGGAIYIDKALDDSTFNASSLLFTKNNATQNGGAIYSTGDIRLVKPIWTFGGNTQADANSATDSGGAIFTTGTATLSGPVFGFNTATNDGGAVYAATVNVRQNTKFRNNTATRDGGAVYTSGRITVADSGIEFISNSATNGRGGAIYTASTMTFDESTYNSPSSYAVEVSSGKFLKNKASQNGGAISAPNGSIYVKGAYFGYDTDLAQNQDPANGNSATGSNARGGALYGKGVMSDSATFYNNTAAESSSGRGGAIYSDEISAYATTSRFDSNRSASGGAIYADAEIRAVNSYFSGNKALDSLNGAGGAIYAGNNQKDVLVARCTFFENTSTSDGGAVFLTLPGSVRNNKYHFIGCYFDSNKATNGSGGAITMPGGTQSTTGVSQCYFFNNSANEFGGAINIAGARFDLSQSTFYMNKVTKNSSSQGGAVYSGAATHKIVNATFVQNQTGPSGNGGALALAGAGNEQSSVFYSTFAGNAASGGLGGAVYTSAKIVLEGSILLGNSANMGTDIFITNNITSGGFNIVGIAGGGLGGDQTDHISWNQSNPFVTKSKGSDDARDLYDATAPSVAVVFGDDYGDPTKMHGLAINHPTPSTRSFAVGSTLDTRSLQYVLTLALRPSTATSASNPAIGRMPGSTAASDFGNFFSGTYPIDGWSGFGASEIGQFGLYIHMDARKVYRYTSTSKPTPYGGARSDLGAYQTVTTGNDGDTGVQYVEMGGIPNDLESVGQTAVLTAGVYVTSTSSSAAAVDPNERVVWFSSDPFVATVDSYGRITSLALGTTTIRAQAANTDNGIKFDQKVLNVIYDFSSTNIESRYFAQLTGQFSYGVASSGVIVAPLSTIASTNFNDRFATAYGVSASIMSNITAANNLRLTSQAVQSMPSRVDIAVDAPMNPSGGACIPLKYIYTINADKVASLLGRSSAPSILTQQDLVSIFSTISLAFNNESGESVTLVGGTDGLSIAEAVNNSAIRYRTNEGGDLVLNVNLLIADASLRSSTRISAMSNASVNIIEGKLVVGDGNANGRIGGSVWLKGSNTGSGNGGGGGGGTGGGGGYGGGGEGGGGGGGCSAGASLAALGALALLARRRGRKND